MNKILKCSLLLLFSLLACRTNNNTENKKNCDTVFVHDTILIRDSVFLKFSINSDYSKTSLKAAEQTTKKFRNVLRTENINKNYFDLFNRNGISPLGLVDCSFYSSEEYNRCIILFFLKQCYMDIQGKGIGENIRMKLNEDPYYYVLFYQQFVKNKVMIFLSTC